MQALFAETASKSPLAAADARTKFAVTALTAGLALADSGAAAQGVLFLATLLYALNLRRPKLLVLLYAAVFIFALASGGVGLMVSSLAATQQQAFLGAFTVGVPYILVSGAVTPVINMPPFLQYASELNPVRHFTTLAQGVFLKDISPAAAFFSLGKIALIALVCILVAVAMFRRRV